MAQNHGDVIALEWAGENGIVAAFFFERVVAGCLGIRHFIGLVMGCGALDLQVVVVVVS